jgi:two-component system sensor histidine kinase LytS
LDDKLKQIESYLTIEHARFGDRIQFEMEIVPEAKEWPLPPLIVQPLVENAVKHGLSGKKEGGKVCVQAVRVNGVLQVQVKDNGVGLSSDAIAHVYKKSSSDPSNSSMGLRNVNQRLEHIYGPSSSIQIDSADQQGTTITLASPMAKDLTN